VCIVDPGLEAEDEPASDESDALRLADAVARTAAASGVVSLDHLEEVAALAARIARRLGASPSQVLRCRIAGLLHDIGKVRTGPHAPGLSHALAGADLIEQMPELRAIAPAVRLHAGAGAEQPGEIPFEARIVGVAEAWTTSSAEPGARRLEQLVEHGFDARVVAALRSVITTPRETEAAAAGGS
jgi:putative nucleotidyltransferase with HDIG domain